MTQSPPEAAPIVASSPGTEERRQGIKGKYKMTDVLCGVSVIILIALLLIVIILMVAGNRAQPSCPDDWIGFQNKCYFFSTKEGSWNASRHDCITRSADLTTIDTKKEMDFLMRHKCTSDHWIGLEMTEKQTLRWVNGTISKIWFPVKGNEKCAYLDNVGAATARCYTDRKWICQMKMH